MNRDLAGMVRVGEFREDLWCRVNVFLVMLRYFLQRKAKNWNFSFLVCSVAGFFLSC